MGILFLNPLIICALFYCSALGALQWTQVYPGPHHCSALTTDSSSPAPCPLGQRAHSGPCGLSASGLHKKERPGIVVPAACNCPPDSWEFIYKLSSCPVPGRGNSETHVLSGSQHCRAGFSSSRPHALFWRLSFLISLSHPLLADLPRKLLDFN